MKLSVIICTFNPDQNILDRALSALEGQTLSPQEWELILVDNASEPAIESTKFANRKKPIRLIRENRPGLAYARLAGIAAVRGEIITFVDDDNILSPDYLERALLFLEKDPRTGAVGGIVEPEFETAPPSWIQPHLELLAIRDLGPLSRTSNWTAETREYPWFAPVGAGMVVRATCLQRYRQVIQQSSFHSPGRIGHNHLAGADDCEMVLAGVLDNGFEVAYCPDLRLLHAIPTRRIASGYLKKLAYESGVSWGEFNIRHGLWKPIPSWTLPLRLIRLYFRTQAWTRSGHLVWLREAGRFKGRAGQPRIRKLTNI